MPKKIFLFLIFATLMVSCASEKKIIYLQGNATGQGDALQYQNSLQPDDILLITVTADVPETAAPYNMLSLTMKSSELRTTPGDQTLITYLIDQNGNIDFPVLGKVKLSGLTRIEAEQKLKDLLGDYIVNPGVNLRVTNFKVSVFGEVNKPGVQNVAGDRVTLFEALSNAGDLTIYGKRKEIKIIREKDNVKTIEIVDITDPEFINSPYYYLAHNDAIYVPQNKTRVNSSVIGPNLTVGISALSLVITILAFATR